MATTITGTVFNDMSHNGLLNPGEPGIPNVFVTLRRVQNGACVQTSTNAAEVRISTTFPTGFNDAAMCPAAAVGPIADIGVAKTASPNPVAPGEVLTYTIVVTNGGPDSEPNVILSDTVSPELLNPEFSINGSPFQHWPGMLNLGTIAVGTTVTVIIRGTVAASASGSISNTAVVRSGATDPHPGKNTATAIVEVPVVCDARCQAITDLIESVALQEAALSHILNAEGEKLQRIIGKPGVPVAGLLQANQSVQDLTDAVTLLEVILQEKLALFQDCLCNNP